MPLSLFLCASVVHLLSTVILSPLGALIMSRPALIALLLAAGLLAVQEPPVRRGQTAAEVRQRFGPPARVSRQILFRRYVEQWHYESPQTLRVEMNCLTGEEPYLCSVLQLSQGPP